MNGDKTKEWHAVSVTVPAEGSDWISHLLIELGSVGNLEEAAPDPAFIAMKGYFPAELGSSSAIIQSILELLDRQGIKPLSTYSTTLKIQNWAEAAQQMFSPIRILSDLTIVSPWTEDYKPRKDETTVVINPGMAFGTGLHATTQLAAKLIDRAISMDPSPSPLPQGERVKESPLPRWERVRERVTTLCDVGCGSAILGIIACKKGASHVDGIEIDDDALRSASENIERNGCAEKINLFDNIAKVNKSYDIVVANILYSTIVDLKERLIALVKDGGLLILSGITNEEDEKLRKAFSRTDTELVEKISDDGWMGYMYKICRNS